MMVMMMILLLLIIVIILLLLVVVFIVMFVVVVRMMLVVVIIVSVVMVVMVVAFQSWKTRNRINHKIRHGGGGPFRRHKPIRRVKTVRVGCCSFFLLNKEINLWCV